MVALLSNPIVASLLGTGFGAFLAWFLLYVGRARSNKDAPRRFALAFLVIFGELLVAFALLVLYRSVAPAGLAYFGVGIAIGQTVGLIWMSWVVSRRY